MQVFEVRSWTGMTTEAWILQIRPEGCFLGELYISNPYECFVLMCILSEDPLGPYADVWEKSYD